jgi:hypothetical protein
MRPGAGWGVTCGIASCDFKDARSKGALPMFMLASTCREVGESFFDVHA